MIYLFTGLPGAGKSYRVAWQLMHKVPEGKYFIFHNVEGLIEEIFEGGEYIQKWAEADGTILIKDFLTRTKQEQITEEVRRLHNRRVLVIIDEAWEFFGKKSKTEPEGVAWLKKHRHYSQEVWLITQHYTDLSPGAYNVVPLEIRAKRGVVGSQFIYQHNVRGETYKTERIPKDKGVFAVYKSFEGEGEKPASTKMGYLIAIALAAFIGAGIWAFGPGLKGVFSGGKEAVAAIPPSTTTKTVVPTAPKAPVSTKKKSELQGFQPEQYSFAGCTATSWLAQEVKAGRLVAGADIAPELRLINCDRAGADLLGPNGMVRLSRRAIVIPESPPDDRPRAPLPPAGKQGPVGVGIPLT